MALAGCSTAGDDGDNAPPGPGPLPPPPRHLSLDGVDPCKLLTNDQLRVLDVGDQRLTPADTTRGPVCQWSHYQTEPQEGYLVELMVGRDIEEFLALPAKTVATSIAGFPAVQTDFVGLGEPRPGACTVLVGVAEHRTVQVSYSYTGAQPVTSEQSCAKARTAAEMATQTLIDRQGGDR